MAGVGKVIVVSLAVLIGVSVIRGVSSAPPPGSAGGSSATLPVGAIDPTSVDVGWSYSSSEDKMRNGTEKSASLKSTNELNFEFPYNGGSSGQIVVRQSPKFGFDIMLEISKGQFTCHSFMGGHVSIKFDDKPIQKFGCTNAADGSSNVIFLKNEKRLLAELKTSKKAIVEAEFYQSGVQQLEFKTSGLKW